jgi:hypothetical protein
MGLDFSLQPRKMNMSNYAMGSYTKQERKKKVTNWIQKRCFVTWSPPQSLQCRDPYKLLMHG